MALQSLAFNHVFGPEATQAAVFAGAPHDLVRDALPAGDLAQAKSGVVMAYGVTGSGKTFSMQGRKGDPGLMPRALGALLDRIRELNARAPEAAGRAAPRGLLEARVSLFEVYQEQIGDLLTGHSGLKLKEDRESRVCVPRLTECLVEDLDDAVALLHKGAKLRQSAGTGLNKVSSRSHLVFTLAVYSVAAGGQASWVSNVSFVDLAGSERLHRTGNAGQRLKESVSINSSLLTLGRCLEALKWNQSRRPGAVRHVPYRQSKITHLFRDILMGAGRLVLLVNVNPCEADYDETVHVLRYAAMATNLVTGKRAFAQPTARYLQHAPKRLKPAAQAQESHAAPAGAPAPAEPGPAVSSQPCKECLAKDGRAAFLEGELAAAKARADAWEFKALESQAEAEAAECQKNEMEAQVREEVAEEMAPLFRDLESSYQARLEQELASTREELAAGPGGEDAGVRVARTRRQTQKHEHHGAAAEAAVDLQPKVLELSATAERLGAALRAAQADAEKHRLEAGALKDELHVAHAQVQAQEGEISQMKRKIEQAEQLNARNMEYALAEERTQLQANAMMEVETLEIQLECQRDQTDKLRQHLGRANQTLAALMDSRKFQEGGAFPDDSQSADNMSLGDEGESEVQQGGDAAADVTSPPAAAAVASPVSAAPEPADRENAGLRTAAKKKKNRLSTKFGGGEVGGAGTPLARRTRAGRRALADVN